MNGSPLPAATLRVHQPNRDVASLQLDEAGRGALSIEPGRAWITAELAGYELVSRVVVDGEGRSGAPEPTFGTCELPADADALELVLRPLVALEVHVRDAATGRPLEHAVLSATWTGAGTEFPVETDFAGGSAGAPFHRLGPRGAGALVPPFEQVEVSITAEGFTPAPPLVFEYDANQPLLQREVLLQASPRATRIRGRVLGLRGAFVDEPLEAWRWTGHDEPRLVLSWRGRTDGDGRFDFPVLRELPDDLLLVRTTTQGLFGLLGPFPIPDPIQDPGATSGESEGGGDELLMSPLGWKSFPVRILGAEPGVPYRGVVAIEERGLALELQSIPLRTSQDGSPVDALMPVPPDPRRSFRMSIGLARPRLDEPVWSNAVAFDGTQGAPLEFTLHDTLTVAGRVTGLDDRMRSRHAVYVAGGGSEVTLAIALLEPNGSFEIRGLPPRRYRIALASAQAAWDAVLSERDVQLDSDIWDLEFAGRPIPREDSDGPRDQDGPEAPGASGEH